MNFRSSDTISVHRSLPDVVESLMALNMELQASDNACQARDALARNTTENCRYARQWQTVTIGVGRNTGKTRVIIDTARRNDVIITPYVSHVKVFDQEVDCVVWSAHRFIHYTVPITHDVDVVWVDNASLLQQEVIDCIYKTYAGRAQQFVLLG